MVVGLSQLVLISVLLVTSLLGANTHACEIVVHPSVKDTELSQQKLRLIFSRRLIHWSDGQPIKVFTFPVDSEAHHTFCKEKLGFLPFHLQRNWSRLVYSGRGRAPVHLESYEEMLRAISKTEGAIGYMPHGVDIGKNSGVLILE